MSALEQTPEKEDEEEGGGRKDAEMMFVCC